MNPFTAARPRILLLGARAPACLEWARFLSRQGCTVYAADSIRPTLTGYSNTIAADYHLPPPAQRLADWQEALLHIIAAQRIDTIIPTCEETFYLAQHEVLLGKSWTSPLPLLDSLHNKYRFALQSAAWGIPAPATHPIDNPDDWLKHSRDYIYKACYSRFGGRTLIRPGAAELRAALAQGGDWLAQEPVDGEEICSYSLIIDGELRAHTAYTARHRTGGGASIDFNPCHNEETRHYVQTFARATGYHGQIGFDYIRGKNGLRAIESNPRATSGIHLLAAAPQALWQTLCDPERPALHIGNGRRVQLALPVLLTAKTRLLHPGFWRNWLEARDVIHDLRDPLPALAQAHLLIDQAARAHTGSLSLTAATTADIAYDNTAQPRLYNADAIPPDNQSPAARYVKSDPVAKIANLRADYRLWQNPQLALPVSISHTRKDDNSYVASPLNHYGNYALAESARHLPPHLQAPLQALIRALNRALRHARLDDVVIANNWLLSTNLYPACPPPDTLRQLIADLRAHYPNHAILFRSLSPALHRDWIAELTRQGAINVAARRIYLRDCRTPAPHIPPDLRRDLALQHKSPLRITTAPMLDAAQAQRIADLYAMLYLDKYSTYNPHLSAEWIRAQQQNGILDISLLYDGATIVGATGTIENGDTFTTPLLGYDTAYPKKAGLYRLLTLALWQKAVHEKRLQHQSAGAGEYKRLRGAEAADEYHLVITRHLAPHQRLAWQILGLTANHLALPLMRKYDDQTVQKTQK